MARNMLIRIGERMIMPTRLGVICAVNSSSVSNQCERSFVSRQVIEDIDESIRLGKVNPNMQDINIQYAFFEAVYQRRIIADMA